MDARSGLSLNVRPREVINGAPRPPHHRPSQAYQRTRRHWGALITAVAAAVAAGATPAAGKTDLFAEGSLATVELRFAEPTWWQTLLAFRENGKLLRARLSIDGHEHPDVGVRFHGRQSFSAHSLSKKVPFWIDVDFTDPDHTIDGRRTLILKNNYMDPSQLREALALSILGEYVPAPRAGFAKLFINGEYWGLYTLVELPDRELVGRWFADPNGLLIIGERAFALSTLAAGGCAAGFTPVAGTGTAIEACAAVERVLRVADTSGEERQRLLPALLDVDEVLRHMAAETAIGHTDGFPANNYTLYVDPTSGRMVTIPWDYNMAFQFPELGLLPPQGGVLADTVWYRRYRGYVRTIIEQSLAWSRVGPWIERCHRLIGEAARLDDRNLFPYSSFLENARSATVIPPGPYSRPGIKEFVDRRQRWLQGSGLGDDSRSSLNAGGATPATAGGGLCFNVAVGGVPATLVVVHLQSMRTSRDVELGDNGGPCDRRAGDGVFSVLVPVSADDADLTFFFTAETAGGDVSFLPASGGFRPFRLQ